jgi:hypothetical protein
MVSPGQCDFANVMINYVYPNKGGRFTRGDAESALLFNIEGKIC